MDDTLMLCPRCQRHVRTTEDDCPFCRQSFARKVKVAAAVAVAITTSVALMDCAYGCPAPCGPVDAGRPNDAAQDAGTD